MTPVLAAAKSPTDLKRALDDAPLTRMHWKVWGLSAMGVLLDGFDLFVIGIALPLITLEWQLTTWQVGLVAAAAIVGAIVGASTGGLLTDRFGRKSIYIIDLVVFIAGSLLCAFAWDFWSLAFFRFLLGIGVGADYPICASYVAEFMPSRVRGRMLVGAFSFQAVGIVLAAVVGLLLLGVVPAYSDWRWLVGFGAIPAIIVLVMRASVPESPRWLIERGKLSAACEVIVQFVRKEDAAGLRDSVKNFVSRVERTAAKQLGWRALLSQKFIRRTLLATIPWFFMDIAAFAVGVFTPVILAALAFDGVADPIRKDFLSTAGAAGLGVFLVVGCVGNMLLVDRVGRMRLQMVGFGGMAVSLGILATAALAEHGSAAGLVGIFVGFILFNLFLNVGPNATTFLLPAELFPTKVRATAHGVSSAIAKSGALLGLFFLPIMQDHLGLGITMMVMAGVCVAGLLVTALFAQETRGRSLEDLEPGESGSLT